MRTLALLPILLVAGYAGCEGTPDAPAGSTFEVVDSGGVRVVHNGGASDAVPAETPTLSLRIGVLEGAPELQFFRLLDLTVGPDGDLYAVDAGAGEVRVFDGEGSYLRTCGRSGDGPGEFGLPARVWVKGDTVIVVDQRPPRVTFLATDCTVLDTWAWGSPQGVRLRPDAPVPGGWIASLDLPTSGFRYEAGVERRDTIRLVFVPSIPEALAAASGGGTPLAPPPPPLVTEVRSVPRGRRVGVSARMTLPDGSSQDVMTATSPLFEPSSSLAVDGLGRIHVAPDGRYLIETYDLEGRLVRRMTRDYEPVPVTDALVARYRDRADAYWDTASMGGEAALSRANHEARAEHPHVRSLPPVGRILASAEGALWVERIDLVDDPLDLEWRRPPPPPSSTRWDRFDPEGRFLGAVTLQPGFSPVEVGEDWALGILRDDLDVQRIARFELGS